MLTTEDTVIDNKHRSLPSWNIQSNGGYRLQVNKITDWITAAEEMCVMMRV